MDENTAIKYLKTTKWALDKISLEGIKMIGKEVKEITTFLDGDIAEVGVSIGNSAEMICKKKGDRPLHLFDTFEGHPEGWIGKYDFGQIVGKHTVNINVVKKRLSKYKNIYFYKGIFPETAEIIKNKKFCFVSLDTDLYKSTYEGLRFFIPRMEKGGRIIIHDVSGIPGVACAITDYFLEYPNNSIPVLLPSNQCIIYL